MLYRPGSRLSLRLQSLMPTDSPILWRRLCPVPHPHVSVLHNQEGIIVVWGGEEAGIVYSPLSGKCVFPPSRIIRDGPEEGATRLFLDYGAGLLEDFQVENRLYLSNTEYPKIFEGGIVNYDAVLNDSGDMPGCYFDVPRMRIFDSVIADVVFVKNYSGFDEATPWMCVHCTPVCNDQFPDAVTSREFTPLTVYEKTAFDGIFRMRTSGVNDVTSGVASLAIDAVIPGVVVAEATAPDELMPRGSDVESTDNKRRPPKRILAQTLNDGPSITIDTGTFGGSPVGEGFRIVDRVGSMWDMALRAAGVADKINTSDGWVLASYGVVNSRLVHDSGIDAFVFFPDVYPYVPGGNYIEEYGIVGRQFRVTYVRHFGEGIAFNRVILLTPMAVIDNSPVVYHPLLKNMDELKKFVDSAT